MADSLIGLHVAQVPDRHINRHAVEGRPQVFHLMHVDEDFQVPAQILEAFGEFPHGPDAVERHAALVDDVDPHPADAAGMQVFQFPVGDIPVDGGDGPEPAVHPVDGIQHAGIVGAVDAGLGQHRALDPAQGFVHRQISFQTGVRRGIAALR